MKSFKVITFSIIASLIIVFIVQLFWLRGLYISIDEEARRDIRSCIEHADLIYLSVRMDSMSSEKEKSNDKKSSITYSVMGNIDSTAVVKEKITIYQNDTGEETRTETRTERDSIDSDDMSLNMLDEMVSEIKFAIHNIVDSIAPINTHKFSFFADSLIDKRGVDSRVIYSELVDAKTHKVVDTSKSEASLSQNLEVFEYWYNPDGKFYYNVYVTSWTKTVLMQMSGILITTLLIFLILCLAFWYLIKTVFRLKTLEEMKDDFTNNMTHELKTPVAVAYSATDALLHFHQDGNLEKREKYLTICKEQLLKLSGLIEQILSMSVESRKTFVLNKEDIQILDLVNNLVDQHKLKANKPISFSIDVVPGDLTINADRTHLSNIISNLIDNGIKYSGDSVHIDIRVFEKGTYKIIEVEDNGIGIAHDRQKYIFDKFYRVPSGNVHTTRGYGLGLFYVKAMIEKHNGTIRLKSEPRKGTFFTIQIP